jgi:hypothetical protein
MRWVPDTQNEALVVQRSSTVPTTNSTRYLGLNGAGLSADSNDSFDWNIAPVGMTIKKLWHSQDVVPGTALTRTITLRGGATSNVSSPGTTGSMAGQAVTCTVTAAATTCSDLTHTYSPVAGGFVSWETSVSGTQLNALAWFKNSAVVTIP